MNEKLILNNQISIMWALMVDMPDYEIKRDLQKQIKETEDYISDIIINENKEES